MSSAAPTYLRPAAHAVPPPGSVVWLQRKPAVPAHEPALPDVWTVDTVSADRRSLGVRDARGRALNVAVADVRALHDLSPVQSAGPAVGDGVRVRGVSDPLLASTTVVKSHGVVDAIYPRFARVALHSGPHRIIATKHLAKVVEPGGSRRGGLYTTPFDDNTYQNDYIKQAETAIRAGEHTMRSFHTSQLIPTQTQDYTRSRGSGRGAKDLGPIVGRINAQHYLLDGHHRAYNSKRITAQYVDLDAAGVTGTPAHKPDFNAAAAPMGLPFDLAHHDFHANPHPIGYSRTHRAPLAYLGPASGTGVKSGAGQILGLLADRAHAKKTTPVRIRADNFRDLSTVEHTPTPVEPSGPAQPRTGYANPVVESKTTPIQALTYRLPTSAASLDSGGQDVALLVAKLMLARGGHASADGTVHGDPWMYQYSHNLGADSVVLTYPAADFARYIAANTSEVFHRGVGTAAGARDLRSGTWFAGVGIYGDGAYAAGDIDTALVYGGSDRFNVTTFAVRPGAVAGTYGVLRSGAVQSLVTASSSRLDMLRGMGMAPAAGEIDAAHRNPEMEPLFADMRASIGAVAGRDANIDNRNSQMMTTIHAFTQFYHEKGWQIRDIRCELGHYSRTAVCSVAMGRDGDSAVYTVRVLYPEFDTATTDMQEADFAEIVDFGGYVADDRTGTGSHWHGLASPRHMQVFMEALDDADAPAALFDRDGPRTEDDATAAAARLAAASPNTAKVLGVSARMDFIQDIGRYALATGIDYYPVPATFNHNAAVITNRNAMVMRR